MIGWDNDNANPVKDFNTAISESKSTANVGKTIEDAVRKFKRVWPTGATHLLTKGDCIDPVVYDGRYYSKLDFPKIYDVPQLWQLLCNREQFEYYLSITRIQQMVTMIETVTIADILTDAVSRIKADYGVNVTSAEFTDSGIKLTAHAVDRVAQFGSTLDEDIARSAPKDATHFGSVDGRTAHYWRYTDCELFAFSAKHGWCKYFSLSDVTDAELVKRLRPIIRN